MPYFADFLHPIAPGARLERWGKWSALAKETPQGADVAVSFRRNRQKDSTDGKSADVCHDFCFKSH